MAVKYPYEYDAEKRKIAKIYTRTKIINGIFNSILIPLVFFLVLLFSGYSVALKDIAVSLSEQFYVPVYVVMFLTLLTFVQLPISFYSEFIYEHKHGLSNQNIRAWLKDLVKELALMYVISVPLISGLYFLIQMTDLWYLYAGALYIALMLFFDYIYPILIFPIFYKVEPLKDEHIKNRLLEMAQKAGATSVKNVEVAKESEKSNKANAMFAGIGGSKRIILFDTLLDSFTPDEVETVVAHELGHYVHRDTARFMVIEAVKIVPVFLLIISVFDVYSQMFGISGIGDIAGLPLLFFTNSFIELFLMVPMMAYSRKREKAADIFALDATLKSQAQISTEKRLADMNLLDDAPHPLVEMILYSHPSARKRIEYTKEWEKGHKKRKI